MSQSNQIDQAARTAGLVGQIGCVTGFASLIIIASAFIAGRFLDSLLESDGIATVVLLLGSFPITLYVIVRISLYTLKRANITAPPLEADKSEDQSTTEENSTI